MSLQYEEDLREFAKKALELAGQIKQPDWPINSFPGVRKELKTRGPNIPLQNVEIALLNVAAAIKTCLDAGQI